MPKFKFICEFDDKNKIQYELEKDSLYDIIDNFESFLKGSGFVFDRITVENEDQGGPFKFQYPLDMNDSPEAFIDDVNFTPDSDYSPPVEQRYDARCFLCGIEKEVMKGYTCHDVKCPKGTW